MRTDSIPFRILWLAALLGALGLVAFGCSRTFKISQKELVRAQKALATNQAVVVEAKEKKPSKWVRTKIVLHDWDYVTLKNGESISLKDAIDLNGVKSARLLTRRRAPALFWPGFGILLGTTIPFVLIGTNMDPMRLNYLIPVFGPGDAGVDAAHKVIDVCNSHTLGCVGKKMGYSFATFFAFVVSAAQAVGFGLSVAGLVFYGVDTDRYDPANHEPSQLVIAPMPLGDGGLGAGLGFRF